MPAAKLRATELRLIDDLFDMGDGYVLDFSNQTFAEFLQTSWVSISTTRVGKRGSDTVATI